MAFDGYLSIGFILELGGCLQHISLGEYHCLFRRVFLTMKMSFAQHLPVRYSQSLLDMLKSDYEMAPEILQRIQDLCEPQDDVPPGFVSIEQFFQARDLAIEHCGDNWLGFRFGERLGPLRLGALGAAASSCHKVEDMFLLFARFANGMFPAHFENKVEGEKFLVSCVFPPFFAKNKDFYSQVLVSATFKLLDDLVGYLPGDISIHFPFSEQAEYAEKLPYNLTFNNENICLEFPLSYAQAPLLTSDPAAHELYVKACESITKQLQSSKTLGASIRTLLEGYEHGYPTLEQIADMLRIPSRTLRERLAKEKLSYRQLLTQCRIDKAKQLLETKDLTVAVIADQLGYGDTANFCRAFKRETGISPSEFRASE